MNVISFEAAYCLFPLATLEHRKSLLSSSTRGIYRNRGQCLAKYAERGYQIMFSVPENRWDKAPTLSLFPTGWRWIDDNNTWVLHLETDGVTLPGPQNSSSTPLRNDPVSVTNWYARSSTRSGLVMILRTFKSDLLGYRYLIADEDLWEHISLFMCRNLRDETKRLGGHSQEWAL